MNNQEREKRASFFRSTVDVTTRSVRMLGKLIDEHL